MNETPEQVARWSSRWIALSWIVLLAGALAGGGAWLSAAATVQRQADEAFEHEARHLAQGLEQALDHHIDLLHNFQSAFAATGELDRATFRGLFQSLDVSRRYPAFVAVQFAAHVPHARRDAFEVHIRAEGLPDYRIHPPGLRSDYLPVVFVEPAEGNAACWATTRPTSPPAARSWPRRATAAGHRPRAP